MKGTLFGEKYPLEPDVTSSPVNIVGGCCGTSPEHISALREIIDNHDIRPRRTRDVTTRQNEIRF